VWREFGQTESTTLFAAVASPHFVDREMARRCHQFTRHNNGLAQLTSGTVATDFHDRSQVPCIHPSPQVSHASSYRISYRFIPAIVPRWVVVVLVFSLAAIRPACATVGDVDRRDALVIGSHKVSAYRVAKNYHRNFSSVAPLGQDAPALETIRAWFARYLADQVITAEALELGYGERAEVLNEVWRMERHMLTQSAGPFYQRLFSSEPAPLPALYSLSGIRQSRFEIDIIRVPKAAPAAQRLDDLFDLKSPDDRELELAALNESGQAECFSGNIEWPFAHFEEIGAIVGNAAVGHWQKLDAGDVLIALRVRRVRAIVLPSGVQLTPPDAGLLKHIDHERIRKEHAREVLREVGLTFDWSGAQRWVERLAAQNPDPLLPLDPTAAAEMLTAPIASYHEGEIIHQITIENYISYYNGLYIRFLPRKALDLFTAVRAMIVARHDEQEARGLGLDREPRFDEDRRNYRDQLALELYLRERVRPALGITEKDVAHYYATNQPAFTRPTHIEGTLVTFAEIDDAIAFARAADAGVENAPSPRAQNRTTMILTPATSLPELPFLPNIVFSEQAPRVAGPFPYGDGFAVWSFSRITASQILPLKSVGQRIRAQLEQPLLDAYAADLARKLSRGLAIEDKIAYAEYGVGDNVAKPWSP
jgi:hypothetical protein